MKTMIGIDERHVSFGVFQPSHGAFEADYESMTAARGEMDWRLAIVQGSE